MRRLVQSRVLSSSQIIHSHQIFEMVAITGGILFLQSLLIVHSCEGNHEIQSHADQVLHLNGSKSQMLLQVFGIHNEPFMYRNENGHFYNGIEYQLVKAIADKKHSTLAFHNQLEFHQENQQNSK